MGAHVFSTGCTADQLFFFQILNFYIDFSNFSNKNRGRGGKSILFSWFHSPRVFDQLYLGITKYLKKVKDSRTKQISGLI